MKKVGKVIEPAEGNIREHERRTAKALAKSGLIVEFIPTPKQDFTKTPDLLIEGERWEMKSPKTGNMRQLEKNLKRASKQSLNIIFDSQRVKKIPDKKIQAFLVSRLKSQKRAIKRLLFVNRGRLVIDISELI